MNNASVQQRRRRRDAAAAATVATAGNHQFQGNNGKNMKEFILFGFRARFFD